MKWWDWMPWSSFSECWALSQLFHSPLSLSSRGFLVPLHFLILLYKCCRCLVAVSDSTDLIDCSQPCSSVHRVFQARILEWVAISFSRGSSQPRDQIYVLCISRQILYLWAIWEAHSNTRMSRIQSTDLTERWRGREAAETLVCCCKNAKWCSHYGRIWQFLIKANIDLPYNSAATPLSIYPNQGKTYVHIKTCSAMLLAGFCFLQYS